MNLNYNYYMKRIDFDLFLEKELFFEDNKEEMVIGIDVLKGKDFLHILKN